MQAETASPLVAECPHCGAELAPGSHYCAQCGRPVDGGETKTIEVPAAETGPVPVEYAQAERRVYGVPPASLALFLAAVALAFAVVLLVKGHWPFGLLLIGASLLLVLAFLEASRRRPEGAAGRSSSGLLGSVRARTGAAAGSVATRGRAARQLIAYRRELKQIGSRRVQLLFELGDAVYRGDEQATKTTREQVKELDELAARRGAEMEEIVAQTRDQLQRRRLEVQATEIVEQPSGLEEERS
jgi:hypothetical protein